MNLTIGLLLGLVSQSQAITLYLNSEIETNVQADIDADNDDGLQDKLYINLMQDPELIDKSSYFSANLAVDD